MADAKEFSCSIVTPGGTVFEGEVTGLILPGAEGQFGILHNHISYMAVLDVGIIALEQDSEKRYLACGGGYAEVEDNEVTILVESAEFADDINKSEVEQDLETAKEEIREPALDDVEREELRREIEHAKSRLNTIEKEAS